MTTELWIDAFRRAIGRIDEQLDAHRITKAFQSAQQQMVDWPSPAQVIALLPNRPEVNRIQYDPPATRGQSRIAFAICQRVISGEITTAQADEMFLAANKIKN